MAARLSDDEIEKRVLRYLGEHPYAMDTVEGIAQWWLRGCEGCFDTVSLARVLRRLVDRAVLEEMGSAEERRYRRRLAGRDRS